MIIIDYNDKRPIYEQIIDRLQTLILGGAFEPDTQLPSVRALAIELSINPNTIQRAYSELERNGYIYSVKGRGNFVRADESLVQKQKDKTLKNLQKQVKQCKELAISQEEVTACVISIYEEVDL